MRRFLTLLIGVTSLLVTLGLSPLAASASSGVVMSPMDVVNTFQNAATGSCLDDNNNPGGGLHAQGCNGGVWQRWNVHIWNDGTRELKNVATGRCLDYYAPANLLRTLGCNKTTYQSWIVHGLNGGRIAFENQNARNTCLDDSFQAALRGYNPCNWGANQAWG